MIAFDGFGWRFGGSSTWALRHVALRIDRGQFVAVAGASGSGKSTLALAMCGLLIGRHAGDVEGTASVDGRDVATTPLHELSESIGLVQQNPELQFATLTVADEIAFGLENRCRPADEIRRRCAETMDLLSISHLADRSLTTLSGGEQQRVAVATVVSAQPQAIVLDEPTASLDPAASRELFGMLANLCRRTGLTVVIIEHKLTQLLPHRPRLIGLSDGRVVHDALADATTTVPSVVWGPVKTDVPIGKSVIHSGRPLVEMSDVTVEFAGKSVLESASLTLRPGEVAAVLGPNGGGKSTLLHCMMGLVQPTGGKISVCGTERSSLSVSRVARDVALVFQNADHQLVADSVEREVTFACRTFGLLDASAKRRADELVRRATLSDRAADHPFRLSWGQKRRLNLISVLLHRPRLLLLDEPFAGQDWQNALFVLELVKTALDGWAESSTSVCDRSDAGACVMVTHDPRVVARACSRVLFVCQGRIVLDAPLPDAFDRLREMGHDAYVPDTYR
ncbi:MAG TPA: ATP-binding cassette domain-containing protein [Phycisphaerae bacterium]|nr:ATP-binding cassette domain-containing protein [Phycisphaerae bacterium]